MMLLVVGLLSLLVGSFLNVVIYRVPGMMLAPPSKNRTPQPPNLLFPRSHCSHCRHSIAWFNNIPLLSFVWLKGQCHHCHQKISLRYPLVELLTFLLSLLVATRFGFSLTTLAGLILTWVLITLAFIDFDHMLLPDTITLPFLWVGLLLSVFEIFVSSSSAILGTIGGYLILWVIYWMFKWTTQKEGMGYGDFKLLAMLGAWLGWQSLPLIILISSFLGALIGLSLILFQKRNKNTPIPFGPFLAMGGFIALLWGPYFNTLYLRVVGL